MIMEVGGIREAISRVDAGESAYDVLRNLGEVSQAEIKKSFGKEGLLRRAMGIKDRYKPVYKAGAQKLVAHAKKSTKQLRQVLRAMTGAWARRSEPKQGSEEYKVWSAVAKTMGWKFPPK